jgi:hypothetical protein
MIVVACDATLYLETCNNTLYFDSHTLGATAQELTMILMNIASKRSSNAMANPHMLASQVIHGVVRNANFISISHNVLKSWISWFSISKM